MHDDYGSRVAQIIGLSADRVKNLEPLPGQVLTEEDRRRARQPGANGDRIDPGVWGQWTSSVKNHQATADEVLNARLPKG